VQTAGSHGSELLIFALGAAQSHDLSLLFGLLNRVSQPQVATVRHSGSGSVREVASNEHEHRIQAVHHDQKGDDSYDGDGRGAEDSVLHAGILRPSALAFGVIGLP
jgi:hypothetical protein